MIRGLVVLAFWLLVLGLVISLVTDPQGIIDQAVSLFKE